MHTDRPKRVGLAQHVAKRLPIARMSEGADYRMAAFEKRADAADARMQRVETLLTDIRLELAKKPSTATLWGILATTVGIAAAMIGVFVGILTYLQAFHTSH
jgi:cytidylate kinase